MSSSSKAPSKKRVDVSVSPLSHLCIPPIWPLSLSPNSYFCLTSFPSAIHHPHWCWYCLSPPSLLSCESADSSRGSRAARHGLGGSNRRLVIQGVLPTCYIWLNHMLTLHVVTGGKSEASAEDTPCSRTVSILRDLNNVPSRYCTFEFLILWNDWLTLSPITLI
jgi:hypothetical protein